MLLIPQMSQQQGHADSEVTNLAQVKAFSSSDYATAAQGTKADPLNSHLLRVLLLMVIKQNWMELNQGLMSQIPQMLLLQTPWTLKLLILNWNKIGNDIYAPGKTSEGAFENGDKTKLDGIEAGADVTDTANVTAAGALMDTEVTNLDQVKAFSSSDYATAAQGTKS